MAIEFNLNSLNAPVKPYPKLMIYQDGEDKTIILAIADANSNNIEGTCIYSSFNPSIIRHPNRSWSKTAYVDYEGAITLKNQ